MSDDLNLDVYFPHFAQFLLSGDDARAFTKLCAVGTWEVDAKHPIEASLCKQFGIKKQADWPLAPLRLMGEGEEQKTGYWFLAHPVHFVLQRDYFTLGDAVRLSTDEVKSLLLDLNQHFAREGLSFLAGKSGDFLYLHVNDDVDVTTFLLSEAMGRDVGKFMPQGKHGMKLQALLNEVQMLLHDHPINQAREQKALLPVNSLWLAGGGSIESMNQPAKALSFQLFANDILSLGLAKWAGIPCQKLAAADAALKSAGDVVVVTDNHHLERNWFAPLLQRLKKKELKALRFHFDLHGMTFTLHLKPLDTWKFWRKASPIPSYFNVVDA
jgi:hypothetical protein